MSAWGEGGAAARERQRREEAAKAGRAGGPAPVYSSKAPGRPPPDSQPRPAPPAESVPANEGAQYDYSNEKSWGSQEVGSLDDAMVPPPQEQPPLKPPAAQPTSPPRVPQPPPVPPSPPSPPAAPPVQQPISPPQAPAPQQTAAPPPPQFQELPHDCFPLLGEEEQEVFRLLHRQVYKEALEGQWASFSLLKRLAGLSPHQIESHFDLSGLHPAGDAPIAPVSREVQHQAPPPKPAAVSREAQSPLLEPAVPPVPGVAGGLGSWGTLSVSPRPPPAPPVVNHGTAAPGPRTGGPASTLAPPPPPTSAPIPSPRREVVDPVAVPAQAQWAAPADPPLQPPQVSQGSLGHDPPVDAPVLNQRGISPPKHAPIGPGAKEAARRTPQRQPWADEEDDDDEHLTTKVPEKQQEPEEQQEEHFEAAEATYGQADKDNEYEQGWKGSGYDDSSWKDYSGSKQEEAQDKSNHWESTGWSEAPRNGNQGGHSGASSPVRVEVSELDAWMRRRIFSLRVNLRERGISHSELLKILEEMSDEQLAPPFNEVKMWIGLEQSESMPEALAQLVTEYKSARVGAISLAAPQGSAGSGEKTGGGGGGGGHRGGGYGRSGGGGGGGGGWGNYSSGWNKRS